MTTPPPAIDIVTVSVAIATALFGGAVGQYVGPYVVIFIGAMLGAAWSASRREPGSRMGTLGYMASLVCFALLITVPLAELVGAWFGRDSRWLLGPVAAVVGGIGDRWTDIAAWAIGQGRAALERAFNRAPPPGGQPPGGQP